MVSGIATAQPTNTVAPVQPKSKVGSTSAANTVATAKKVNTVQSWATDSVSRLPAGDPR
jgi:hypothetical protein